jgi:hypothetical protein
LGTIKERNGDEKEDVQKEVCGGGKDVEEAEEPTSSGTGGSVKEPDFEAERHSERMRM